MEKKGPSCEEGIQPWKGRARGEVRGKGVKERVEGSSGRSPVKLCGTPMAFDLAEDANLIEVGEGVLGDSFYLP